MRGYLTFFGVTTGLFLTGKGRDLSQNENQTSENPDVNITKCPSIFGNDCNFNVYVQWDFSNNKYNPLLCINEPARSLPLRWSFSTPTAVEDKLNPADGTESDWLTINPWTGIISGRLPSFEKYEVNISATYRSCQETRTVSFTLCNDPELQMIAPILKEALVGDQVVLVSDIETLSFFPANWTLQPENSWFHISAVSKSGVLMSGIPPADRKDEFILTGTDHCENSVSQSISIIAKAKNQQKIPRAEQGWVVPALAAGGIVFSLGLGVLVCCYGHRKDIYGSRSRYGSTDSHRLDVELAPAQESITSSQVNTWSRRINSDTGDSIRLL